MKTLAATLILGRRAALAADPPSSGPAYTITLGPRTACATPMTSRQARADGGFVDVTTPSSNVLAMSMSGSVAANAFLGHTSSATETFHLEQEFEIEMLGLRPRASSGSPWRAPWWGSSARSTRPAPA